MNTSNCGLLWLWLWLRYFKADKFPSSVFVVMTVTMSEQQCEKSAPLRKDAYCAIKQPVSSSLLLSFFFFLSLQYFSFNRHSGRNSWSLNHHIFLFFFFYIFTVFFPVAAINIYFSTSPHSIIDYFPVTARHRVLYSLLYIPSQEF